MKKILIVITALMMVFAFAACGSSSSDSAEEATTESALDLTGEWTQSNADSETDYMIATIDGDTITIDWVLEDDTDALYWAGTYEAPTEEGDYSWTSENDKDKTEGAEMASDADTKEFTYSNDVLSFEASIAGETSTVEMKKD